MAKKDVVKTFTVCGKGNFPADMLRYDRCWPVDSLSAMKISDARYNVMISNRTIELNMYDPNNFGPTKERWKSFGWFVVNPDFDE